MSIKLMSWAWETSFPQTEKMVLLCLCDFANDNGDCWPAVDTIAKKCSVTDRTVQRAIKRLTEWGILSVGHATGKANQYHIHPRHSVTPDTVSPPKMTTKPPTQCHPTPDTVSPKPSKNHQEPSVSNKRARKPAGVSDQVWSDFQEHRKAKRAPLTASAMSAIEREAAKAGWEIEDALTETMLRGWQGFKAKWVNDNGRNEKPQAGKRNGIADALDREIGFGEPTGSPDRRTIGGSAPDRPRALAAPRPG